jgi:NAD(P)-dependent dehydrogenase (short-subunit alcohol dehydrogenase family)
MTDAIALVTGGSRGIGAATAALAAERGYAVAINYRADRDAAEAVRDEIERAGGRAICVRADVADEVDVVRMFAEVDASLGPLSALVNNAGIVATPSRLDAMTGERLHRMAAVNLVGSLLCAREAVRRMSTRHGGRGGVIVNVSSSAIRHGSAGEWVDYAATKGAIDTFTLGLAREVAREGIRVAGVRPGLIDTGLHAGVGVPDRVARMQDGIPAGRAGEAVEVSRAILWLLSEEASYSTGAILDVSGGR